LSIHTHIPHLALLRRSGRVNKGQPPPPPDTGAVPQKALPPPPETGAVIRKAPPQRGKKRSAAAAAQADEEPMESTSPALDAQVAHPQLKVVIQSPPDSRPTQRLRLAKDREAVQPSAVASEEMWVGRGNVSPIDHLRPYARAYT
jgi:hypothetical protein